MNNGGIVSQYGFLFQRKAFVLYILKNMNKKQRFVFEGKDDIEIASNECIHTIYDPDDFYIQVKSGNVSEYCFSRVICNWLLLEDAEMSKYELIIENDLSFVVESKERVQKILEFIISGKSKKSTSIARKTYDKFKEKILNNRLELEGIILAMLTNVKKSIYSMEDIDSELFDNFSTDYCSDIIDYPLAKQKRLERFIYYIDKDIDNSIKDKRSYTLIYSDIMKYIIRVSREISDNTYVVDLKQIKKRMESEAKKIVTEGNVREVNQLSLVDDSEGFIIDGIVRELIYKDFREIFIEQKEVEISNIELIAKENHDAAVFMLGGKPCNPKEVYNKTIQTPIESSLLPNGSIYRNGCYVYLTGDQIDDDTLITWGEEYVEK